MFIYCPHPNDTIEPRFFCYRYDLPEDHDYKNFLPLSTKAKPHKHDIFWSHTQDELGSLEDYDQHWAVRSVESNPEGYYGSLGFDLAELIMHKQITYVPELPFVTCTTHSGQKQDFIFWKDIPKEYRPLFHKDTIPSHSAYDVLWVKDSTKIDPLDWMIGGWMPEKGKTEGNFGAFFPGSGVEFYEKQGFDMTPLLLNKDAKIPPEVTSTPPTKPTLKPTARTKRILELAVQFAHLSEVHYIGTEHLMLAIVEDNGGVGGAVLQDLGVTKENFTKALQDRLDP